MKGVLSSRLIGGTEYSWINIKININGVTIDGIISINYEEAQDVVNLYARGATPYARSYGRYTYTASLTVHQKTIQALQLAARSQGIPDGDITGLALFDVIVAYIPSEGQGLATTDILRDCSFMSNMRAMNEGDTAMPVTLPIMISGIDWAVGS